MGGVCSGLAAGLRVDTLWVRIAFVLLAPLQGIGVLLYFVLWVVMPEHPASQQAGHSRFDSMMADVRRAWVELQGQFGGPKGATPSGPAESSTSAASAVQSKWRNPSVALGLILAVVGVLFLADNLGLINWNVIWPAALVVIGVLLLARSVAKRS